MMICAMQQSANSEANTVLAVRLGVYPYMVNSTGHLSVVCVQVGLGMIGTIGNLTAVYRKRCSEHMNEQRGQ